MQLADLLLQLHVLILQGCAHLAVLNWFQLIKPPAAAREAADMHNRGNSTSICRMGQRTQGSQTSRAGAPWTIV